MGLGGTPLAARSADTPGSARAWTPWIPVALWFAVVAGLGTAEFQYEHTSRIIGPLLHWLFPAWSDAQVAAAHGVVRKGAHLTEYAIAAVLTFRALWLTGRADSRLAAALPTLALVAAVATADETRQAFVASRTASPRDVAIDVTGGAAGLGVAPWIAPWLGGRRRERRREDPSDA